MKEPQMIRRSDATGEVLLRYDFSSAPREELQSVVDGTMPLIPSTASDPIAIACRLAFAKLLLLEGP